MANWYGWKWSLSRRIRGTERSEIPRADASLCAERRGDRHLLYFDVLRWSYGRCVTRSFAPRTRFPKSCNPQKNGFSLRTGTNGAILNWKRPGLKPRQRMRLYGKRTLLTAPTTEPDAHKCLGLPPSNQTASTLPRCRVFTSKKEIRLPHPVLLTNLVFK